jgi:hypothetical protein
VRFFATVSCLLAVMLGAIAIFARSAPLQSIVFNVGGVWLLANFILSRAYTRAYWKGLDKSFSQIWSEAKSGTLPKTSALEQVTNFGAFVLMFISMCLYFV